MKNLWLFLFAFCPTLLFAQEQLGLRLENYAGINGVTLNPAANLSNPLRIDINLVSAGVFVENNYFFIKNTNAADLIKNGSDRDFYNLPDNLENTIPADAYVVDYFNDNKIRHGTVLVDVMGSSFAFKIGAQHSVGLFTRARQLFSTQNLPNEFSYYRYDAIPLLQEFQVDKLVGATMTWSEIGLNYAFKMPTSQGSFGLGANLRYLQGYDAFYFRNDRPTGFTKSGGSTVTFGEPQISFGFTRNNLDTDEDYSLQKNGNGIGADLGVIFMIQEDEDSYILKLGASLIDLGFINFNQNAENHTVTINTDASIDGDAYANLPEGQEVEAASRIFSEQITGDTIGSLRSNSFQVNLPTALSLQADYALTSTTFINATLVQRVPFNGVITKRTNVFAVTPRFEHRWFSASLPLILYNWQDFRIGFAARLGYLIVGTDNLGSWVGKSDFTGTDLYAGLKINFSELNFGTGGSASRRGRRGSKVKCYF